MPVPFVAVELGTPTPDRAAPTVAALIAACSDAAQHGPCALGGDTPLGDPPPRLQADITWSVDRDRATILVSVAGDRAGGGLARHVVFAPTDPLIERWRSVGFVTGTLANQIVDTPITSGSDARAQSPAGTAADRARAGQGPAPTPTDRGTAPTAPAPSPGADGSPAETARTPAGSPAHERSAVGAFVEVGPMTGPGLAEGPWRLGGFVRVGYGSGPAFLTAAFSYSIRERDEAGLAARWVTPSIGGGYRLFGAARIALHARAEVAVDNSQVSVVTETGAEDSGNRWLAGLKASCDAIYQPVDDIGLLLGVELAAFPGAVHVNVADARAATVPFLRPALFGGLRVTLPGSASP